MRNKTSNIYTEWLPLVESLPDEQAGTIFKNILKYQNGDNIICNNPIWIFIKSKLDDYNNKGEEISEIRKIAGQKGGLAKASNCYQKLAKSSKSSNKRKEKKIKEENKKENKEEKLSHDFILSEETKNTLQKEGYGQEQIDKTLINFKDYWINGDGKGKRKTNWQSTFRNWIRKNKPWKTEEHFINRPKF